MKKLLLTTFFVVTFFALTAVSAAALDSGTDGLWGTGGG